MPDASFLQTSFLGGEFSPVYQGRADDPRYHTGLNVCRNVIPLEEGSATRRPGIRLLAASRANQPAVVRNFHFSQQAPYTLELTERHMRFFASDGLVVESSTSQVITAITGSNPAVLTTASAHGWSNGDQLQFQVDPADLSALVPNTTVAQLLGREWVVVVMSSTSVALTDSVTGVSVDGTTITLGSTTLTAYRVHDQVTPYLRGDLKDIRTAQGQTAILGNFVMLLHNSHQPTAIVGAPLGTGVSFTYNNAVSFTDGPYLDIPTDLSTITPSGTSGSVTLTASINLFSVTDVGRSVRLFSEPAVWAGGTTYAKGDQVKYNGVYYQSLAGSNTGNQPDTSFANWAISTNAAVWMWAKITAYTSSTAVTATLNPVIANGITGPNLPRTTACQYRMGLYSDTTGWPRNGLYHEGRLWLAGAQANRLDSSVSNSPFDFTPTAYDGTVADNNGLSAIFNADDSNEIYWMVADTLGIIAGTAAGEWLVSASQTNDPITPTSIQAHRRTKFGSSNIAPVSTGASIAFVGRFKQRLMEYITTDFRGLSGKNLSVAAKHLRNTQLAEIAYVREKTPIIYALGEDGRLMGCTYKRESAYASDPPTFFGWHHHDLGEGLKGYSISTGPNYNGDLDSLTIVLTDGTNYWTCLMTDIFDSNWQLGDACFVDLATAPRMWKIDTGVSPNVIRLYGLSRLAGFIVDVMIGGIDCGQFTVAADGTLAIPVDDTTIPLLTSTYLASLATSTNFQNLGMSFAKAVASSSMPTYTAFFPNDFTSLGNTVIPTPVADWDNDRLYEFGSLDVGLTQPAVVCTQISTRQFVAYAPVAALADFSNCSQIAVDRAGFFYSFGTTSFAAFRYSPATMLRVEAFGTPGGPSSLTNMTLPYDVAVVGAGANDFMVIASATSEVTVFQLRPFHWCGKNYTDTDIAEGASYVSVCRGRTLTNQGEAFLAKAGTESGTGVGSHDRLGFYRLVISPSGSNSLSRVATVLATQIDATWTHFNVVRGMFCDESDGNVVMWVSGTTPAAWSNAVTYILGDVITNGGHVYSSKVGANLNHAPSVGGNSFWNDLGTSAVTGDKILKVNASTGAVLWSANSVALGIYSRFFPNRNRVRGGKLVYVQPTSGGQQHMQSITLATGAVTDTNLTGQSFQVSRYQLFNDQTGYLATMATWSNASILNPSGGLATTNAVAKDVVLTGGAVVYTPAVAWTVPAAIGFTYPSQGQILRVVTAQESGAANGPSLGKTRRVHQAAFLFQQAQGVSVGTDFTHLHAASFQTPGGTPYAKTQLFSGVLWDSMEDDYSFDSMVCWEIDRPYPATVLAVEPFLHTQDR